jgi:hypothetical protein
MGALTAPMATLSMVAIINSSSNNSTGSHRDPHPPGLAGSVMARHRHHLVPTVTMGGGRCHNHHRQASASTACRLHLRVDLPTTDMVVVRTITDVAIHQTGATTTRGMDSLSANAN